MEQDARKVSVKDLMKTPVVTIDVNTSITDASKMMEDTDVGAIIITENNTPIGIITDRDFAVKVVAHAYNPTTTVKMIMSSPLLSIGPDETVRMVADLMNTRGIRKLPVIEDDKVIGIITASDLVKQFAVCTSDDLRKMYSESIARIYQNSTPYN